MGQNFMKLPLVWGATVLAVGLGIAACSPTTPSSFSSAPQSPGAPSPASTPTTPQAEKPRVVVTASVLCDLTEQIAQSTVNVDCILEPGTDPHVYEPTPADRRAMEDAALILFSGFDYEPALIRMVAATNAAIPRVAVFEKAVPKPLMGKGHDHDHGADKTGSHPHDHGHEQGETEKQVADPHIWHNPLNGIAMAAVIRESLTQISPDHASLYQQNTEAIATQLQAIDAWIKAQVATVPPSARKLVTPHDSFRYFAQAYGFTVKGTIEGLSTEERPSPSHLAALVDLVKNAQVPAIFSEQTTNPQLIQSLARAANVRLAEQPLFVEGPGGPSSAAPTYQDMLITNTCTIVNALGGTCDPATASVRR